MSSPLGHAFAGYPQATATDSVLNAWQAQFTNNAAAFQGQLLGAPPAPSNLPPASVPGLLPPGHVGRLLGTSGGLHGLMPPLPPGGLPALPAGLVPGPPSAVSGLPPTPPAPDARQLDVAGPGAAAEDPVERQRRAKEERAKREADSAAEAARLKCHLHTKPKNKCKFCQRHLDFLAKANEAKAAAKEKFASVLKGQLAGRGEQGMTSGPLELISSKSYGFPPMLQTHIVESTHYKTLKDFQTLEEISHELVNFADTVEPYVQNSATSPSAIFCCTYRLLTMNLNGGQLRRLIESEESPYIRCAGFLFVRFGLSPDHHWSWLGEYLLDEQEVPLARDASAGFTTVGEYVESLLTQDHYYSIVMTRLPVAVKRHLETRLAPVAQDRKRTKANRRLLATFGEKGTRVEACIADGEWRAGEVRELLSERGTFAVRPKVRIRFDGDDEETLVHLGRVILADNRRGARSSGRGRDRSLSMDWSRERGKSATELLDEHRRREQDKAVCSSGKDYSRRLSSFQLAMPREQGNASKALLQTEEGEGGGGARRPGRRQELRERSPEVDRKRKREEEDEHKLRMRQLYEKYGSTGAARQDSARHQDIEKPDVMRLG